MNPDGRSKAILVNSRTFSAQIIKLCDSHLEEANLKIPSCISNFGLWAELCICNYHYCNRFAVLRESFQQAADSNAAKSSNSYDAYKASRNNSRQSGHEYPGLLRRLNALVVKSEKLSTNKALQIASPEDADFEDDSSTESSSSNNKHLAILLILVPLGIGGLAVVLVMCNYYCKHC